jgi:hypothetical protein
MATAALDRALLDMDAARKAFETAAVRVAEELEQLQERVIDANSNASRERESTAKAVVKRRRRSGAQNAAPLPPPAPAQPLANTPPLERQVPPASRTLPWLRA